MTAAPTVVVHSVAHARAALDAAAALGVGVTLRSPADAMAYLGAGYVRAMVDAALAATPGAEVEIVADCGGDAGHALAALRAGFTTILFDGAAEARGRLADIARQQGAEVTRRRDEALDLIDCDDVAAACADWLSSRR